MFEIESKKPEEITITTKKTSVTFNVAQFTIDAGLQVGKIHGPGEFEIGDATIRGIAVPVAGSSSEDTADGKADGKRPELSGETIYDVEVGGVHIGIIGDICNLLFTFNRRFFNAYAVNVNFTVKVDYTAAGFDGCSFSGAVVTDESVNFTLCNLER